MKDFTELYAVPGENSIIDGINPDTGLTLVFAHTEAQVLEREPKAVRMTWAAWSAGAIERQQATAIAWEPSTAEQYDEMLNVLPPAAYAGGGFLVGEPYDHCFKTGAPRFQGYRQRGDVFEVASRPMTIAEFRAAVRL